MRGYIAVRRPTCNGMFLPEKPVALARRSVKKGITGITMPNPIITTKVERNRMARFPDRG